MKRILSLLLVLCLFLPALSFAELEEDDFSSDELEEEILLDIFLGNTTVPEGCRELSEIYNGGQKD